jgi:hypothetical protein
MTRSRTLHLPALLGALAAAVVAACAVALLAVSGEAEATFPGKPGKIAYSGIDGPDSEIYTIKPGGGGRFNVTDNGRNDFSPSYSPSGKKIAYTESGRTQR